MKDLIVYSQDSTLPVTRCCSEKACATCFENRGCIYERYLFTPVHHGLEFHVEREDQFTSLSTGHQSSSSVN